MVHQKAIQKTEYTVTRIAYSVGGYSSELIRLAQVLGKLRSELWNKYGSLQAWGVNKNEIIKQIRNTERLRKTYGAIRFNLSSEIWERTVQAVLDDIHAVQDAAKLQIIRKIYATFKPEKMQVMKANKAIWVDNPETSFRDELLKALNSQEWRKYPLLCRWVRQYYQRGHTWVDNQIVINSTCTTMKGKVSRKGKVTTYQIPSFMNGKKCQWLEIKIKTGRITPKAGRLRLILKGEKFELHYPQTTKVAVNFHTEILGVDKGFTEGFYGSNGMAYAEGLGKVIKDSCNVRNQKNKNRQKLWALSRKYDPEKAAKILENNLGRKKAGLLNAKKRNYITQLIRTDTKKIFSEFGEVVAEDLSKHIKGKKQAKAINRKLNEWTKGELQKALDEISIRKGGKITLVNCSYTSQVDHRNGTLLGKRVGDRFLTFDGVVLHADQNAAANIKNRATDIQITRFMKKEEILWILRNRTALFLAKLGHSLESAISMGWLDEKHLSKGKPSRRRR